MSSHINGVKKTEADNTMAASVPPKGIIVAALLTTSQLYRKEHSMRCLPIYWECSANGHFLGEDCVIYKRANGSKASTLNLVSVFPSYLNKPTPYIFREIFWFTKITKYIKNHHWRHSKLLKCVKFKRKNFDLTSYWVSLDRHGCIAKEI